MAQPHLNDLTSLVSRLAPGYSGVVCKHFFSGAALYVEERICGSLTPRGLALKLPSAHCDELFATGGAIPLRYFEHAPVKRGYALFPDYRQLRDADIAALIGASLQYASRGSN